MLNKISLHRISLRIVVVLLISVYSFNITAQVDSIEYAKIQQQYEGIDDSVLIQSIESSYRNKDSVYLVPNLVHLFLERTSSKSIDSSFIIKAIRYEGLAHRKMGNYVLSIEKFRMVYDYSTYHRDSLKVAEAADQIGIMNTFMGNMQEAQGYLLEAAHIYNLVGSDQDIASANNGLAIFYNDLGNKEKAIETYNLSLKQFEALDDTMGRANVHANLGLLYLDEKNYSLAEKHLLMQGYLDTLMQTEWGLGFHHDFMGMLKREQKQYDEALKYFNTALDIRQALPSHYNIAETRSGLASTYNDMGLYDDAILQSKAILDHKDLHQSLSQEMRAYEGLSKAYESKGNYKQALLYEQKYKIISDSIYNRDMLEEVAQKDALYEKVKQDREIESLSMQNKLSLNKIKYKNRIIVLCLAGLIIILFLACLLYRLYQKVVDQKQKIGKALDDKDLLLREIHHRVKNNLQLVSSLLTLQGRSISDLNVLEAINDGKSRVRSMALIHQDLYNRDSITGLSVKQYLIKLCKELFDTYHIDKSKILLSMDIQDIELDIDTMIPLGLIINELITNSLKYAFPRGQGGKLDVSLKESDKTLQLVVSDNGIGYDPTKVRDNAFGSNLIASLTEQLNGELTLRANNGTWVEISFRDYKVV